MWQTRSIGITVSREIYPIAHHYLRQRAIRFRRRRVAADHLLRRQRAEHERDLGDVGGDRRIGRRVTKQVPIDGRATACSMHPKPLPALLADYSVAGERGGGRLRLRV